MTTFIICPWGANDVIRPVEIDLGEAHAAGYASLSNSNRSIAAYIAQQIERQFPSSQASRAIANIEQIVRFMNPLLETYNSGMAVRVPGIIPATGGSSAGGAGISQKDLDDLRARYESLLKSERAKSEARCHAVENMLHNEQNRTARLQVANLDLEKRRVEAETKLRTSELELQQRETQLLKITGERDALTYRCSELEMQLEYERQRTGAITQQLQDEMQRRHEAEQSITVLQRDRASALDERNKAQEQQKSLQRQLDKYRNRAGAAGSGAPRAAENLPEWI